MNMKNERIRVGDRVVITRRGKRGRYTAEFHHNGQHRRQSLRTSNRREATNRAVQLAAELAAGAYLTSARTTPAPTSVTLEVASEEYLKAKQVDGLRRRTLTKYRGILTLFTSFCRDRRVHRVADPPHHTL